MNFKYLLAACTLSSAVLFTACKDKKENTNTNNTNVAAENTTTSATTKIAYIDLDTLDSKYLYIVEGKKKFEAEQKNMEAELKRLEQTIKSQYADVQKRINEKSISEVELESVGKKIEGLEQNYQRKMQSAQNELMDKTAAFQNDYRKKVDDFLREYNKDGKYDYILSYQKGVSLVLFANNALDITNDVVEGLNAAHQSGK